jgi:membrane-bound serine protease (ClpP class)
MKRTFTLVFFLIALVLNQFASDTTYKYIVYKIDVKEMIAPPVFRLMQKSFEEAENKNADLIVLHMNTYGGMVETADSIRTRILNSKIPVITYIDNNAASAGALISIACDSIYMRKGANIGAATVVNQNAEAMPDKYQSYMRSTMRATAEAKGRRPEIAEAMVDPDVYIESISDSGKVLTFTANEAYEHDYCEGIAENIDEVLSLYGIENYELHQYKQTPVDKIIHILLGPALQGILIMIIIGGIYFELQSPGLGFPSAASLIAAVLYFAPLYLEGLAANWEIVIFIVGIIFIAVEIFALPGFGIAGATGMTLFVGALVLAMVNNINFDFTFVKTDALLNALFLVIFSVLIGMFLAFYFTKKLFTAAKLGFALFNSEDRDLGYISTETNHKALVGKTGISTSMLRPTGKVFIEGDMYQATAESSYIDIDVNIKVVKEEKNLLIVRKID